MISGTQTVTGHSKLIKSWPANINLKIESFSKYFDQHFKTKDKISTIVEERRQYANDKG